MFLLLAPLQWQPWFNPSVQYDLWWSGLNVLDNAWVGSEAGRLWACNFGLQLAKALTTESDYSGALRVLESASKFAAAMNKPQLEVDSYWSLSDMMAP